MFNRSVFFSRNNEEEKKCECCNNGIKKHENVIKLNCNHNYHYSCYFSKMLNKVEDFKLNIQQCQKCNNKLNVDVLNIKNDVCSICLEKYNHGYDICKLKCNHEFHYNCISRWGLNKNTCPLCRLMLSGDDIKILEDYEKNKNNVSNNDPEVIIVDRNNIEGTVLHNDDEINFLLRDTYVVNNEDDLKESEENEENGIIEDEINLLLNSYNENQINNTSFISHIENNTINVSINEVDHIAMLLEDNTTEDELELLINGSNNHYKNDYY